MPQSCPVALNASGGAPSGHVEIELMLPRPDVRAVAVDHERQIAEQRDAVRCRSRAAATANAATHCRYWWNSTSCDELAPRLIDRGRLAPLQRLRPLRPRPLTLAGVNRAEQAVVLDPPGLLADEPSATRRAACGVVDAIRVSTNRSNARRQRRALQAPDRRVVDPRRRPHGVKPIADRPAVSAASPPSASNSGTAGTWMNIGSIAIALIAE